MPDAPPPPVLETPELPDWRVCLLIAKTGHGKTSVSRERAARFKRKLFVDSKARHTGVAEYWGMLARTGRELQQLLRENLDREAWAIDYTGPVSIPVDPTKPDGPRTSEAFFRAMARIPDFLLVVEEAENYMTSVSCPEGLFQMAREGRTLGQCLTLCAHRPADLSRKVTAIADGIVAWPGIEPGDMEALKDRGFDLELLRSLQGHNSLRLHAPEGGRQEFYVCRCETPHSWHCGEPLARSPVKVSRGDTQEGA